MAPAGKGPAKPGPANANVAGMDPDSFVQGGLASDFDGTCVEARFCPWDYRGTVDPPALGVRLTVRRDDGEDDVVQYYSAGDINKWVPSMDGNTPSVDADSYHITETQEDGTELQVLNPAADGIYAFKIGQSTGLSQSSNWAQFIGALLDAEFPRNKLSGDIRFMEGVHGHWDRVPQIKRSGIVSATDKKNEILILSAISEAPAAGNGQAVKAKGGAPTPKAAGGAASKPVPSASSSASSAPSATVSSGGGDLDASLTSMTLDFLKANDGTVKKSALAGYIVKNASGLVKTKGVKRCTEVDFLNQFAEAEEGERWYYDADEGTLTYLEP